MSAQAQNSSIFLQVSESPLLPVNLASFCCLSFPPGCSPRTFQNHLSVTLVSASHNRRDPKPTAGEAPSMSKNEARAVYLYKIRRLEYTVKNQYKIEKCKK